MGSRPEPTNNGVRTDTVHSGRIWGILADDESGGKTMTAEEKAYRNPYVPAPIDAELWSRPCQVCKRRIDLCICKDGPTGYGTADGGVAYEE